MNILKRKEADNSFIQLLTHKYHHIKDKFSYEFFAQSYFNKKKIQKKIKKLFIFNGSFNRLRVEL